VNCRAPSTKFPWSAAPSISDEKLVAPRLTTVPESWLVRMADPKRHAPSVISRQRRRRRRDYSSALTTDPQIHSALVVSTRSRGGFDFVGLRRRGCRRIIWAYGSYRRSWREERRCSRGLRGGWLRSASGRNTVPPDM
jgi:hypothetical protein